jgi:hypothetical protein
MTTRGRQLAALFGLVIVFFLPKRVDCGYPEATCGHAGMFHTHCTDYEVEPLGFYLLEYVFKRDIGFAYSSGEDCH